MDIPHEAEAGAWGILPGFGRHHHPSSDATLFSSSLPVLPHGKLQMSDNRDGFSRIDDTAVSRANKFHESVDDIESHSIGNLLPDEEDLLAGMMDELELGELPDADDFDLFGSGGGMELDTDFRDNMSMSGPPRLSLSSLGGNAVPQFNIQNGAGTVAGEHPYGEHPSRTLFVRNINSNVEDSELRTLFEQYGDIRTLYTTCKHRGFVMISYYDIRSARMAMRSLQNKPLRRRKLDIHFSIPKDNPSEKDMNQGTLVVFNLDPSISNDDLHGIFGAHGEIKEIRETPHKRHHKFVEFYDVRGAEAALKALNRCEIAGKRIKVEPSRPGGARRSLMLQLNQELENDDLHYLPMIGSPMANSPPSNWLLNSPVEGSPLQSVLSRSPVFGLSPTRNSHLSGLASALNSQGPSSKLAPIGRTQIGSNVFQQSSPLFQEPKLDNKYTGNLSPSGPLISNGGGIETLSGSEFLWGSPNTRSEPSSSSVWSTSSTGNPLFSARVDRSVPFPHQHQNQTRSHHHFHVGSAPSGVPLEKHFGFVPESSKDTLFMNSVGLQGMSGMGLNGGSFPSKMTSNGIINPGSMTENGFSSYRMMSSPRFTPMFLSSGLNPGRVTSGFDGLYENGRPRRVENNSIQVESRKQFQLDLDKILKGEDSRTTLMIKNIPNKYTSKMLLAAIDEKNQGTYNFLYLPIDFKNKCNVGYAFINMLSPELIIPFYEAFNGKKWEKFNSEKVASLAYARIQGKSALIAHFQNSSLMNEDMRCRPIIFDTPNNPDSVEQVVVDEESKNVDLLDSQLDDDARERS
ncbi:PREDICTED: protein MEI2-like 5 isoform X2 [Camelina sativa]|uniref:Protein MEI2-like 5 isoform X1 n=1 Tax=Camelina sativa TaxID=90675 RepID=A0ABM0WZ92_CAMSA|nr:PREDICTED: protein MEI2-like 5 isoform X1 [Camelina sativa]XP_010478303.1 PREDICTED: protein MEI2-like 5 isoform X2 [Camelina sativa]